MRAPTSAAPSHRRSRPALVVNAIARTLLTAAVSMAAAASCGSDASSDQTVDASPAGDASTGGGGGSDGAVGGGGSSGIEAGVTEGEAGIDLPAELVQMCAKYAAKNANTALFADSPTSRPNRSVRRAKTSRPPGSCHCQLGHESGARHLRRLEARHVSR